MSNIDDDAKRRDVANILEIKPFFNRFNEEIQHADLSDPNKIADLTGARKSDVCLITGDGPTLPEDVQRFESWGIDHDVYCVNRSMLYFHRPINHWAAIDAEESMWFSQYLSRDLIGDGQVMRHTIGSCQGYDVYWKMDEHTHRLGVWAGNTGYFAVLSALYMDYKKIVLAGMPLTANRHWYDPEDADGPRWIGACYTQWMDFAMKNDKSNRVKSMSGYSAFILGDASEDWLNNADIR